MVEILSIHNYYDGMISGTCFYEGKVCWFSCCHMRDLYIFRTYRVFRLSQIDQFRLQLGECLLTLYRPKYNKMLNKFYHFMYRNFFSVKPENSLKLIGAFGESEFYLTQRLRKKYHHEH